MLLIAALSFPVLAQHVVGWHTMDSGGGSSSGGAYVVTGTIGQPDPGTLSGGSYVLQGGFWGMVAVVQTPGAPLLRIAATPTNTIVVAWSASSTNFQLQQSWDISSLNWSNVTATPFQADNERRVIVAPPAARCFYRLKLTP